MLNFIKNKLSKIYSQFTSKIAGLFGRTQIDENTLKELEKLLISADTGVKTTRIIIEQLKNTMQHTDTTDGEQLKKELQSILLNILSKPKPLSYDKNVYLLVGINGSGKTTFAGKLAHSLHKQGKKVLLVAADTFRAAAPEQLRQWAEKSDVDIVIGKEGQDPASVVFQGCEKFAQENYDAIIIDTAGRLHTKVNLMNELAKIKKVISKKLPDQDIFTLLAVDSMLGQNSFEQAKLFKDSTDLNGIVLTKMDGTGKGGIVFAIANELEVPIAYITFGEQPDQFKKFDAEKYVNEVVGD